MKSFLTIILLLFASFAFAAVSLDEIVKLSKLKTSDDVIIHLIQKEGLNRPVTSKEVIYLKEQGVSDRVVQYLVKVSDTKTQSSEYVDKDLRAYYTTTKDGKRVRVITNIDEQGKRMGGEIPPQPEPEPEPQKQASYERSPQEIRVVVEDSRYERETAYEEPPEYVDDKYVMPPYPQYDSYYYSSPYIPYYQDPFLGHGRRYPRGARSTYDLRNDLTQPNWNFNYRATHPPLVRPSRPSRPIHQKGATAGAGPNRLR
jgi:hypothetical protein